MCANILNKSKRYPFLIYSMMMALGIIAGLSNISWLQSLGLSIADIFINIFKCISMPIIALSLIVTLSSYKSDGMMPNVWRKALLYTFGTTIIAAGISCILYLLIDPTNLNHVIGLSEKPATNISYWQHLTSLIPTNIISPFIENQVMAVLFIGITIGIAIRFIPEEDSKLSVTAFFKGIHAIFFTITKWVIVILPIGIFGFITSAAMQVKAGMDLGEIGKYLLIIVAANLIQGFIILPLWLRFNGIKPFQAMRLMMPALLVAFFSKSSAGTLPITLSTAENRLKLQPSIARFVLPLCTSLNMNGCAAFIFTTVIFLMQNNGLDVSVMMMIGWIFIATIAAVGNAGVPMGCFFLSASLLSSMNVPIVLLGIILPFYAIIDMIETALNVWSDSCVANVIDKKLNKTTSTVRQPIPKEAVLTS